MKELLINFAFDLDNSIVFAKDAVKGIPYKCPECGQELVFKSSGNTGPGSRRPHFAHKGGGGSNCTPESLLHSAFKIKTAEILQEKINCDCKEFILNWKCEGCNKPYSGNILYMAKDVKIELDLGVCRPDIALLDANGKVIIAVEIVNTHYPEDGVLKYYRDNGIVLVQYNVTEDDLLNIEERLQHPDHVSLCLDSNCISFSSNMLTRRIRNLDVKCIQCHRFHKGYIVELSTAVGLNCLANIQDDDIVWLNREGVSLRGLFKQKLFIGNNSYIGLTPRCNCSPKLVLPFSMPVKRRWRF